MHNSTLHHQEFIRIIFFFLCPPGGVFFKPYPPNKRLFPANKKCIYLLDRGNIFPTQGLPCWSRHLYLLLSVLIPRKRLDQEFHHILWRSEVGRVVSKWRWSLHRALLFRCGDFHVCHCSGKVISRLKYKPSWSARSALSDLQDFYKAYFLWRADSIMVLDNAKLSSAFLLGEGGQALLFERREKAIHLKPDSSSWAEEEERECSYEKRQGERLNTVCQAVYFFLSFFLSLISEMSGLFLLSLLPVCQGKERSHRSGQAWKI